MDEPVLDQLERKLAVVRDRVRGVAARHYPGLYLYGRPGTSKTFTVRSTLNRVNAAFNYHTGHLTALGLFEMLRDNPDALLVLDDVGALFDDRVALQILLAATGKQGETAVARTVTYRRQGKDETAHVTGGIIAISNLDLHGSGLLSALRSRLHTIHYNPTDEQIAALMREVIKFGWPLANPSISPEVCREVAEHVISESKRLGRPLDMRVLLDKALPDFGQCHAGEAESHWRDLVTAALQEETSEGRHSPTMSRDERKLMEQRIAERIRREHPTSAQQQKAWEAETGKSSRAFFRRLKDLGDSGQN